MAENVTNLELTVTQDPSTKCSDDQPPTRSNFLSNLFKLRGIFYALLSALLISLNNILIRKCKSFSASEMALVRFVMQMSIFLPYAIFNKISIFGEKGQRLMLSVRGIAGTLGLLSMYFAVKLVNPSDALALFNTSVIFVTISARIFLKEKLTLVHLLALILTMVGICFITQPSFLFDKSVDLLMIQNRTNLTNSTLLQIESKNSNIKYLGYGLALFGSLSYTVVTISLKELANKKAHLSVVLLYATYYALPASFLISVALLVTGIDNRERTILTGTFDELKYEYLFVICGGCISVSYQILMNLAVQLEDASKVSILKSTDLLFIYLLQYYLLDIQSNFLNNLGAVFIFIGALSIMAFKIVDKKHTKNQKIKKEKIKLLLENGEVIFENRVRKFFSRIIFSKF